MNKNFLTLSLILIYSFSANAQEFSLFEIVELAKSRSIAYKQAETRKKNRYWQYRVFKSNYNPQLYLNGTLPNYTRRFNPITQPDGSILFQPVSYSLAEARLGIQQSLSATGANFFLNSNLNRYDDYARDEEFTQYSGDLVELGIQQPIFRFNQLKWDKKIEPLKYEESKREYAEELEDLSLVATDLFFDLMIAQVSYEISLKNLANNDTIFQIGKGRFNLGTIPENQLLQLELTLLNSQQSVEQAKLDMETSRLRLRSFLGLIKYDDITLELPESIPTFTVEMDQALDLANQNRSDALSFERRLLEANRDVAKAKGDNGLNLDFTSTFGYTNRGSTVSEVYNNPQNQLTVNLGFAIPIIDWGRSKSRIETAVANQELTNYIVEQEKMNFEQEVFTVVSQLEMLRNKVRITNKADQVAQSRYEISKNRYLIGKIDITDLNIALQEKDNAKRDYIQSLRDFWNTYYNIRKLTLFDFENGLQLYNPELTQ